jgi:hypothetical protein
VIEFFWPENIKIDPGNYTRGKEERWDQVCKRPAKCPEMAMGTRLRDNP